MVSPKITELKEVRFEKDINCLNYESLNKFRILRTIIQEYLLCDPVNTDFSKKTSVHSPPQNKFQKVDSYPLYSNLQY